MKPAGVSRNVLQMGKFYVLYPYVGDILYLPKPFIKIRRHF